jgi:large repetitive protein
MRLARISVMMIVAAFVMATIVTVAPAADAQSSPYFHTCTVQLSAVAALPGSQLTVTASGFPAGSVVTFTIYSTPIVLGTATANASGDATLVFTLPAGLAPGMHTITATGLPPGDCDPAIPSTQVMVDASVVTTAPATTAASGTLPRTGTNSAELVQLALVLIVVGGLITLAARKRTRRASVDS